MDDAFDAAGCLAQIFPKRFALALFGLAGVVTGFFMPTWFWTRWIWAFSAPVLLLGAWAIVAGDN